jgi:hypothetical protein
MDKTDRVLSSIYYHPGRVGSFSGFKLLRKQANQVLQKANKMPISHRVVELWLSRQEPYVLHKQVRTRKFVRNPVTTKHNKILSQVQADIIHFADIPHYGYKYLLLCQDVVSRYIFYRFLKTKTCKDVLHGIKTIFEKQMPFIPNNLQTDAGLEFQCKEFKQYMSDVGCNHFFVGSGDSGKTPHLDNVTRTLQNRLHRYFTYKETTNWVKVIPQLVSSQNRTVNRITGKTPKEIWDNRLTLPTLKDKHTREERKFKIGEWVSILGSPLGTLSHAYKGEWTTERFQIVDIKRNKPNRLVYYLQDAKGERIKNGFYSDELTRANFQDSQKIERVLRRKTVNGVPMVLVRYKRLGKNADSWIKASQLKDIPKIRRSRRRKR